MKEFTSSTIERHIHWNNRLRLTPQSLRTLQPAQFVFGLSVFAVLLRLGVFVVYSPFIEGDTELLVKGHIKAIRACLQQGRLLGCPESGVWPLFQHLPSILLSYLGFSSSSILHALAYLSFLSFLGSVLLIFWTLKKKTSVALAITGILITITSPLLWYSHSTFGEMAAAFLILAFTVACLMRAPSWLVALLFVLAGSTKEIAFPFLVAIGLLCFFVNSAASPRKKRIAALVAAATFTLLATIAFNYFRYGTFFNKSYALPLYIVPTFRLQLSFFLGIWLSPNGGLAFFWPSFVLLYLTVAGVLLLQVARRKLDKDSVGLKQRSLRFYAPILTISAILFLLTAGFSRWCTPLGGAAWGPRFMLPWIPALVLLLIYFYCEELEAILKLVLSRPAGFVLACATFIVISIPQFAILFGPFVLARIFSFPECPRIPIIQEGVDYYYQCIQTQVWPRSMVILELFRVAVKPPALWFSIPCAAVVVSGLYWMRKNLIKEEVSLNSRASAPASLPDPATMLRAALETPRRHCLFVFGFYSLLFVAFFFPTIYHGALLAIGGDGLLIYLPNFYSHKVLWDPLLFSGFPMMADPQVMTWYPPAAILSLLSGTWNLFMLMAYVAGSAFMYGYVYTLTKSRFGALVSGIVFGLSGFMIAHLIHAVIIQSAAWIPLTIWSLEMLRRRASARWLLIGSVSVTLSFLGGHSQIAFYGLMLGVGYAITLGWGAPIGRSRYFLASLLMIILGLTLAAVQIVPTTELARQGLIGKYNFQGFVAFSLPVRQALTMIFPLVYGGRPESGMLPYFGSTYQAELTGYVGLLSLVLAAVGVIAFRQKALVGFWICVALLAFALATGDATPLARLLYHVPILNSFRAPARHLIEVTMALSVLSGLGVAAIIRGGITARLMRKVISIASLAMLACLALLFMNSAYMSALAARQDAIEFSLRPWTNRAVGVPLIVFLLSMVILAYWRRRPGVLSRQMLLIAILLIDLGSFGWFFEWRYAALSENVLVAPAIARRYKSDLEATNQRLMPYQTTGGLTEMAPNLTRLWGIPSGGGYNVLVLSRISTQLPMIDYVSTPLPWAEPNDKSLDLMAVRYVFLPPNELTRDGRRISWFKDDMKQWLGSGCNQPPSNSATFTLFPPVKGTGLAIVSRLACSSQVPDQTEVARVRLVDAAGVIQTRSLLAGRDTSEWAYDCGSVKPQMRHQRANIFNSYPALMNDRPCEGHFYLTKFSWDGAREIKSIEFEWLGKAPASMIIEKVSLIDDRTGASSPVDSALVSDRWRFVEATDKERVYENLRAMPRAWLTEETVSVNSAEALSAIKTGRLPDGREFDPARMALIEVSPPFSPQLGQGKAVANVTALADNSMEVRTVSTAPRFLITSDAYYPGWRARIDGQETLLYRADYSIRGVMVPAGEHVVRFEYRPRSFYIGATVSMLSLLAAGIIAFWRPFSGG